MRWKKAIIATIITIIAIYFTWDAFKEFINVKNQETSYVGELNKLEKEGVPNKEFKTKDASLMLHDIDTPVTLLHFWASWCAPCIEEFPSLVALAKAFEGKITILAVSLDESKEEYEAFLQSLEIENTKSFIVVRDDNSDFASSIGTEKLPETYILDRDKKLIRKVPVAENWESPQVMEFINYVSSENTEKPENSQ